MYDPCVVIHLISSFSFWVASANYGALSANILCTCPITAAVMGSVI